jgi:hypothetical protein
MRNGVVTHRLRCWLMAVLVASMLCVHALGAADAADEHWSVELTSPESGLLMSAPCPAVMPTVPSSLNVYVKNLTDTPLSASALTFSITVAGRPYCTAVHPQVSSQEFLIAPHAIQSIGVGFVELMCRDGRDRIITREDMFKVLARGKWSVSATILEGARVFTSNPIEFPLSRDRCEGGVACYF